MDRSLSGFSVQRILQARILEWVAIPSSLSLWRPCTPFSGYFFSQFTVSMKASACSCLLPCGFLDSETTTDSAGKGLVGEQRTKEERVNDQSADGLGKG